MEFRILGSWCSWGIWRNYSCTVGTFPGWWKSWSPSFISFGDLKAKAKWLLWRHPSISYYCLGCVFVYITSWTSWWSWIHFTPKKQNATKFHNHWNHQARTKEPIDSVWSQPLFKSPAASCSPCRSQRAFRQSSMRLCFPGWSVKCSWEL